MIKSLNNPLFIHYKQSQGMAECSVGLAVTPKKGAGALFYSKKGNGVKDENSIHGGCPPTKGNK